MNDVVTIDRELLERVVGEGAGTSLNAMRELRAILAAPRHPEGEGLEVVGWYHSHAEVATSDKVRVVQWLPECIEPLCRLSDAQRAIAELRDRLDVMTQCADNYSRMFEESAEECEHWKSGANAEAARADELKAERDTLRQQLAELRDMLSGEVETNIPLRQKAFDLTEQRDKLAEILRDIVPGCKWKRMRPRIDAALAEVKPCQESPNPAAT